MNPEDFIASPVGSLAPTEYGQFAFVPDPLPPANLRLESMLRQITTAHTLVGKLAGVGRRFANPYLLIRPLQRKEAVASSGIEGTYTTLHDLLLLELGIEGESSPRDTREVLNYVKSLEHALAELSNVPISSRLIKSAHELLLQGVKSYRGGDILGGVFKRNQNYIGGTTPENARFVPSPPGEVDRLMGDLETFIHSNTADGLPELVVIAMVHYQIETIHPFPDGNGRVGRLLIPLLLKHFNLLDEPLLFVSPVLEERKNEYINHLYDVSRSGNWNGWIEFFLEVVIHTCTRTIDTLAKLHDLNLAYLDRVQKSQTSALLRGLINSLFEWPVVTIPEAASNLGISYPAAKNNIEKLVEADILAEIPDKGRPRVFYCDEIINLVDTL